MIFSKLCLKFYNSPNYNPRADSDKIKYLIPHCTDGLMSYTGCHGVFGGGTNCSCNYLIDKDGIICGVVAEENRSWCTSSRFADFAGITIEIASEKGSPCRMSENVLEKFVELATDICKRNGKSKLLYFGDNKEKALSYNPAENELVILFHKWFAENRTCPEKYFISRCPELVERINKNLSPETVKPSILYKVQCGAFADRKNAEKLSEQLKKAGFDNFIING